jgi:hypothetical protein
MARADRECDSGEIQWRESAPSGTLVVTMQTLHVVPDTQGNWSVVDEETGVPVSRHASATGAELAARSLATVAHAEAIYVHDRYYRMHRLSTREAVRRDRGSR